MSSMALPQPRVAPGPRAWEPLKQWRRAAAARRLRRRVHRRDFSILSNDCWGGMAYEELGLRYETPFIGLFLVPEDYMRLLRAPRRCLASRLELRDTSRHAEVNEWRAAVRRDYPVGVLADEVELQFLHYQTPDEARAKWERRVQRIRWNNLLVKICWHDDPRMDEWLREFDALPFGARVSFAPRPRPGVSSCVCLRDYSTDGTQQYWRSHKYFDLAAWINEGVIRRVTWARLMNWLLYWHY